MSKLKSKQFLVIFALIIIVISIFPSVSSINKHTSGNQSDITSQQPSDANIENSPLPSPDSIESSAGICKYIARETNNQIGVYSPNDPDTPLLIIETNIKSLPQKDQLLLSYGISLESDDELKHLIEDYSS